MVRGAASALKKVARDLQSNLDNSGPHSGGSLGHGSPAKGRRGPRGPRSYSSGSDTEDPRGPRIFPGQVKNECWSRAEQVPGRDPERWRKDAVGNVVFRKLNSCEGCLCHDFDHVVPYSQGGHSTVDNCQLLQTRANRVKSDRIHISRTELQQRSVHCVLSKRDMDAIELGAYGDVHNRDTGGGCRLQ